jgi:deoxyribodipyrimidine photo-lyase
MGETFVPEFSPVFSPAFAPMFVPTVAAAQARIAAVRPAAYARTRNALGGAVSQLSPYITHGFVTLADVLAGVVKHHAVDVQHKFVYELGWRAYFRHVWQHRGDGILQSLHEGPLPDAAYARELPADIRQACTGVPMVDEAVRTLYATGMLHNHARMWLASYVVHVRKVHWRSGADWLYGHLLDGDLASNHLSWQWVAGTGSSKPYLFNADNVARYAPAPWHSPGAAPALFPPVDRRCDSFSQWWNRATRGLNSATDLLAVNEVPAW